MATPKVANPSMIAATAYAKQCGAHLDEIFDLIDEFETHIPAHIAKMIGGGIASFWTFGLTGGVAALAQLGMNDRYKILEKRVNALKSKLEESYGYLRCHAGTARKANQLLRKHSRAKTLKHANELVSNRLDCAEGNALVRYF